MDTINDRFLEVRKAESLSQEDFARKINRTRSEIKNIEYKKTSPKEEVIRSICRVYGVDDVWLRTGVGEMFSPRTREDEITAFCADLLGPDATDFQRDFVSILATLSPEGWDLLEKKINELAELSRRRKEKQGGHNDE